MPGRSCCLSRPALVWKGTITVHPSTKTTEAFDVSGSDEREETSSKMPRWDKRQRWPLMQTPTKNILKILCFPDLYLSDRVKAICSATWVRQHGMESRNAAVLVPAMFLLIHNCHFPSIFHFPKGKQLEKKGVKLFLLDTTVSDIYISVVSWEIFRFYTVSVSVSSCKVLRDI